MRYKELRREVGEAFEVACAEQALALDEARIRRASASVLAVMDGLQVQWLLEPGDVDLGETSAFAIEAIVASVLAPQPNPLAEGNPPTA